MLIQVMIFTLTHNSSSPIDSLMVHHYNYVNFTNISSQSTCKMLCDYELVFHVVLGFNPSSNICLLHGKRSVDHNCLLPRLAYSLVFVYGANFRRSK